MEKESPELDPELLKEVEKINNAARLELANQAKNDLYFLDNEILGYKIMEKHVHGGLCKIVESLVTPDGKTEYLNSEQKDFFQTEGGRDVQIFNRNYDINDMQKKFRLILMPRGSFKTSCVTIGFTLQLMLQNPDLRVMIDSEVFDKSRAFINEIKGHLEDNEAYRNIFKTLHGMYPDSRKSSDKWTDSELNVSARKRKAKEPNITAAGIGTTKVGMHYDVIIADDLHSEKNITTKESIDAVIDHYRFLLSLLEPDGIMIIIGTRWDYNDLYQHIIDNESHRFTIYARQAIRPDGSLFFPERLTKEFLDNTRTSQNAYIFSCQYQNLPVDDKSATFKNSQIRRIDGDFIDGKPINWFLMVDPAISQEKTADYTAMVVAGMDGERNIYIKDIVRARMMPSEIIDNIFRLYETHNPQAVGVESVAYQKTLIYSLNDRMKERGWWIPLKEVKRSNQSKEVRIKGLQPFYEFGHIFHLKECPYIDDLEYELLHFPRGQTDDMIDALADILEIGYQPMGRQVKDSEETRKKKKKLFKIMSKPRSAITRY